MPAQAAVMKYAGKRGTTWSIKYRDASGKQIREGLGKASDGWTKKKAEAALRARLVAVDRDHYRRPDVMTFESFVDGWVDRHADSKGLKRSTRASYRTIVNVHLLPAFGPMRLENVTVAAIEAHIEAKRKDGVAPATLHRQLASLSLIMRAAVRRGLVRENPVPLVDRPRADRRRWRILTPAEVTAVERAFDGLIVGAETDRDRDDLHSSRAMFMTMMATGVRRGELLGLRWRCVFLADPDGAHLKVEETYVRNAADTPKSVAGQRTIAIGRRLADLLFDQRQRSPFDSDDDLVFPNPRTGNPFGVSRYSDLFSLALGKAGITDRVRPFHDLRHSSITNSAAAGTPPEALMSRAGHSDYATTRRYVDTAGERFREEADRLEERLWGGSGTKTGKEVVAVESGETTPESAIAVGA